MSEVTSYDIKEALARKHGDREFFMTEVKNGATGVAAGQLLQFDGVAIYKSWTNPQIRGYEIKVSRSDFLRDAKYPCYLPYFHEFYFVVPKGMIKREELEDGIGLMYYDPDTGTITTKRRAVYRNIEPNADFLLYIIMNRLDSDRAPFMLHKEEAFHAWFNGKQSSKELAYRVKSKLLKENVALEVENRRLQGLKDEIEKYEDVFRVMAKHGIRGYLYAADELDKALTRTYPPELDSIRQQAAQVTASIDKLKFSIEQEEARHAD
ncbi:MAG: hypothetical protein RR365_14960 [Bacteroides sp.]